MKKLFYLSFLLPVALLASCSNDNDLADVDINLTLDGVTVSNQNFYTVEGNDVTIDNLSVTSLTDKPATIVNVRYFLNGMPIPLINEEDMITAGFSTTGLETGTYTFEIAATVLQVDKSITSVTAGYPIHIVAEDSDLPADAGEIGTYTLTVSTHQNK